jgi:hypothetical protein
VIRGVQARHQLALQARCIDQLRIANGGAEVGEQPEIFAQAQDRLLGAERPVELVVFPVADRAEQHRIGVFGELQSCLGQRVAEGLVSRATDQCRLGFKLQVQNVQNLDGFGDDFGANAITRQNCNFHFYYLFYSCLRR